MHVCLCVASMNEEIVLAIYSSYVYSGFIAICFKCISSKMIEMVSLAI